MELNKTDKTLEIIGWISVFGIWTLTLINYFGLPEIIPIHYNALGKADGFGNKSNIIALPIISTILFIGITFLNNYLLLNKYPHMFNYPSEKTEKNALKHYINTNRMLRVLKLVIVLIFGLIVFRTIQNINGNADGLGIWFLPLMMAMIFVPMIYFFIKTIRNKETNE
jgi:uncharacterized membrane protein